MQHEPHRYHMCIDAYQKPEGEWFKCPNCKLTPLTWCFNNGRSTACGCWTDTYDTSLFTLRVSIVYTRELEVQLWQTTTVTV